MIYSTSDLVFGCRIRYPVNRVISTYCDSEETAQYLIAVYTSGIGLCYVNTFSLMI